VLILVNNRQAGVSRSIVDDLAGLFGDRALRDEDR